DPGAHAETECRVLPGCGGEECDRAVTRRCQRGADVTSTTMRGSVTAASIVPSATAPETGFTSRWYRSDNQHGDHAGLTGGTLRVLAAKPDRVIRALSGCAERL